MYRSPLAFGLAATLSCTFSLGQELEEVLVSGTHDKRVIDVTDALVASPDAAQLLKKAPGANVNGNGPLSGIPQYRGMFGPRIATTIDGAHLAPAGPNWMDPPVSYAAPGQLQSLSLYRGIAPVSVAQESIGGAIEVTTHRGEFGDSPDFNFSGQLLGSAQSVNSGSELAAALYGSNDQHRIKLAALTESGDDAGFPDGDITPSEYERQRYDLGYGLRQGSHEFQLDYTYTDTGDTGTPALPMDIEYFEGDLYSFGYSYTVDSSTRIEASIYGSELDHGMSNYHLRQPPMPGMWRRNIATADNLGFKLQATVEDARGRWLLGLDGFEEEHNSDIDNPKMPMFFVVNFNGAERRVLGGFLERQQEIAEGWRGEFGLRYNHVSMDADEVDGSPAMTMPPATMLRDAFNNADREQTDNNLDLVARLWFQASRATTLYAGLARKHRSPSYQERYLWLPLQATGGLADGHTYTGNIELNPEASSQLEFGLDFNTGTLSFSPRIFYNRVDDYIQGTASEVVPAVMLVGMMNMMNGSSNPPPLQFNNVDAELYGFDMDWSWRLAERWTVSGIVNYVRGKRRDTSDNLYRIAPPNTSLRLDYSAGRWGAGVESVLYAEQDKVSETNGEQATSGYGIVNLSATWQATPTLQLAAGVDNLLDKEYQDHLGGYNRAANPDVDRGARLPGYGTNVFARVVYEF